jgi:acyl carrier protein
MSAETPESVRETLSILAKDELGFTEPLPKGELSEHLDSIQRLSFVVAIEDHYEINFESEDDEQARTINDVISIILRKI